MLKGGIPLKNELTSAMWNRLFYKTEKSHAEKKKMEYNKIFRVVVTGTVINTEKEDRQELGPGYQREDIMFSRKWK